VLRDELVYILPPIENSAIDSNIRTASTIGALAVEFSDGTPPVGGAFFWIEKVSFSHFSRILAALCGGWRENTAGDGWLNGGVK
jgi:hypothetical protein